MSAFLSYFNELVNKNKQEFGQFEGINWLNQYQAEIYEEKKQHLIDQYSNSIKWSFKNTKPWINRISKGCECCGQGEWSCIFITGQCNASCFYCPAPQKTDDIPMAQQLKFESSEHYADFINFFNFKGVSFSGGEPFLVYDRLKDYLGKIRKKCHPDIYIWMYTNGILGNEDRFKELKELGLNEVRFDIGATNYELNHIQKAKGLIDHITIEIPLDPNKKELIKDLLPKMAEIGVHHLNLHQLRLTTHNAGKLLRNNYTILHGEHPVVLESELAVLELLDFADRSALPIGINYCAFQYKHRFQKAGYRNKLAGCLFPDEKITENGYMLNLYGGKADIPLTDRLTEKKMNELLFHNSISRIDWQTFSKEYRTYKFVIIDFSGLVLENKQVIQGQKQKLRIGNQDYFYEKGRPAYPTLIKETEFEKLINLFGTQGNITIPEDAGFFQIWKHLYIENGFRPYL